MGRVHSTNSNRSPCPPRSADAQQYPDGQVQFVVTGYYNTAPLTVALLPAKWGACYQSSLTTEISINSTGVAQCGIGAVGTYVIWANDPLPDTGVYSCPSTNPCGEGCVFSATAQLTCP
ncbi:MAG: hypothetical protein ABSF15_23590 [Candidatus Sulfotelmatobacter sp.]